MKIAILGGSFDPPHVGHLLVAQQIKRLLNIDQVWLMPTYSHPFNKSLSTSAHRLAMVKLLEDDTIKASSFEIQKKGVSYTIDTLKALTKEHP
nr:adenylyltransferase/cytidyltransferase family protein [Candidatus Levybacteria bacterium]